MNREILNENIFLKESNYLLQTTLNSLTSGIIVLDKNGEIVFKNAAFAEFAEKNNYESAFGNNYLKACKENPDGRKIAEAIGKIISGKKENYSYEYKYHIGQKRRWFNVEVIPFKGLGSFHVLLVHSEITEKKLIEESQKNLLDNLPYIIFRIDNSYKVHYISPAYERIYGKVNKNLPIDITSLSLPEPLLIKIKYKVESEVNDNGKNIIDFNWESYPDGDKLYNCKIIPELDAANNVETFLLIVNQFGKKSIKESKDIIHYKNWKQLFVHFPDGVVLTNSDLEIIDFNHAFTNIFKYKLKEVKGKKIDDLLVPEKLKHESKAYNQKILTENYMREKTWRLKKNGSLVKVKVQAFPIIFENNQFGFYIIYSLIGGGNDG